MLRTVITAYKCLGCDREVQAACRVCDGSVVVRCSRCGLERIIEPARCHYCKGEASFVNYNPNRRSWYRCYCIDCTFHRLAKKGAVDSHPHPLLVALCALPMGLVGVVVSVHEWLSSSRSMPVLTGVVMFLFGIAMFVTGAWAIKDRHKWIDERNAAKKALNDPSLSSGDKLFKYFDVDLDKPLPPRVRPRGKFSTISGTACHDQ